MSCHDSWIDSSIRFINCHSSEIRTKSQKSDRSLNSYVNIGLELLFWLSEIPLGNPHSARWVTTSDMRSNRVFTTQIKDIVSSPFSIIVCMKVKGTTAHDAFINGKALETYLTWTISLYFFPLLFRYSYQSSFIIRETGVDRACREVQRWGIKFALGFVNLASRHPLAGEYTQPKDQTYSPSLYLRYATKYWLYH